MKKMSNAFFKQLSLAFLMLMLPTMTHSGAGKHEDPFGFRKFVEEKEMQETQARYKQGDESIASKAQLSTIVNDSDSFMEVRLSAEGTPRITTLYNRFKDKKPCIRGDIQAIEIGSMPYIIRPGWNSETPCKNLCSVTHFLGTAIPVGPAEGTYGIFIRLFHKTGTSGDVFILFEHDNKICLRKVINDTSGKLLQDTTECTIEKKPRTRLMVTINKDKTINVRTEYQPQQAGTPNTYTVKNTSDYPIDVYFTVEPPCGEQLPAVKGAFGITINPIKPKERLNIQPGQEASIRETCPLKAIRAVVKNPKDARVRAADWRGQATDDSYFRMVELSTAEQAKKYEQGIQQLIRQGPVMIEASAWSTPAQKAEKRKEWVRSNAQLSIDPEPPANLTPEEKELWKQVRAAPAPKVVEKGSYEFELKKDY